MTSNEKIELLKDTIYQLYSKEGRSKVYISKLLKLNRKNLGLKIKEWEFPEAEPIRYLKPSQKKFLNKNKEKIISCLKKNDTITDIAKSIGIDRSALLRVYIKNDTELLHEYNAMKKRKKDNTNARIQFAKELSSYNYVIEDYEGEEWRPIKNFDGYQISNYGRVKHYAKTYDAYHLLTPYLSELHHRYYVSMVNNDNKQKNIQVARLVGFMFVDGYSEEKNTINHKDGNTLNNFYQNLEWTSQSENNLHAYRVLRRRVNRGKRYKFTKIIYKDKYEFKTIAALSRFMNKSETQVRRYIDEKHPDIKLII